MAFPTTGDTTSASAVITALADTTDLSVGMQITCVNFPAGSLILTIDGGTQVTMDTNATASSTGVTLAFATIFGATASIVAVAASILFSAGYSLYPAPAEVTVNPPPTGVDLQIRISTLNASGVVSVNPRSTGTRIHLAYAIEADPATVTATAKPAVFNLNLQTLSASPAPVTVTATADLDQGMDGIGVCHVVRDVFRLWGIENPCQASTSVRERAINDLNSALQTMWAYAKEREYFTRANQSVTITSGNSTQVLDNSIQNVIGPARITSNNRPLVALGSIDEVENYGIYYQGSLLHQEASGTVKAYYIERTSQVGNDPAKCTLHMVPTPTSDTTINFDAIVEAPRYVWNDYLLCTRIPIPHQYVETLLLPIIRYRASSYRLFYEKETKQDIINEYQMAIGQLDMNDPNPAKERADNERGEAS